VADAQSGHEKTLTSLLPALAGANLIYGLGMLESGVTIDYAQLVMDAEFARMIKFCVPGIPVTDETLSVDVIAEIGPFSDFLSHDDTYRGMRGQSRSTLIDRRVREEWAAAGSTTIYDRARAEACRLLETHQPQPLTAEVASGLRAIIAAAERELGLGQTEQDRAG
jgi:trimethylamine--corrinoid protein Co-methyltransferase